MRRTGCVLVSGFRRRVAARSFAFYGAAGEWEGHLGFCIGLVMRDRLEAPGTRI